MRVERVVLDTNVLISAVLSRFGKPFACLGWVLDNATLIVSRELLEELETRLARPKFSRYVNDSRRRAFVADLALSAAQVELPGLGDGMSRSGRQQAAGDCSCWPGRLSGDGRPGPTGS